MKKFFDLRENKLSEAVYDVSWGLGVETQVVATDANDAIKKAKEGILKRIPKLAYPKYADTWKRRPSVHKIREENEINEEAYKADAEKSKFKNGWRAKLLNPQGKVSYLSQHTFKSKSDAIAYARQYHDHVNMQNRNPDRMPSPDKSKLVESFIVEDAWEEIPMMQRQLKFIAYAAEEIMEYLDFGVDPEEWYQNKLAQVHMQMQTLYAYMEGEEDKDVEYDDEMDDDDMEEMRDPAHPYLHGGKHSKNLSSMGWPTKDVKIHQGAGKHYINVHQYKESLDEADQTKRMMSPLQKIRMDKEKADKERKMGKDPAHKRLNGPGGVYKNLVKRFGEEIQEGEAQTSESVIGRIKPSWRKAHQDRTMDTIQKYKERPKISLKKKPENKKADMKEAATHNPGVASEVNEKLKVSDGVAAWVDDFKKSDAPQFKGRSEKERRDMAIAAFLSAKQKGDRK